MKNVSGSSACQTGSFCRAWTTLLYVAFTIGSAERSRAQAECGMTTATPLRVENATGADLLRAAANCAGGGSLDVDWAGVITLGAPISIASGMFLSITGEDALAEVRGGSQTRMFEVSPGGGLTLTQLKLSGGAAENGGAVHSDSAALVLDSCFFHYNVATDGDGGAVWAGGGIVTITGGEFVGNNASSYGGAVAAMGVSSLAVQEGSTFQGNTALVGGALYCSGGGASGLARCSLNDTLFTSNTATGQTEETASFVDPSEGVDGGGAVAFLSASADITDSMFGGNHAQFSGGAMLGGKGTDIIVHGCKFENNTAVEFGGAIAAASMTLGGNTQLSYNSVDGDAGAVLGWDPTGAIIFNAVNCTQNTAIYYGGCFRSAGKGVVNDGTFMHGNIAAHGGCIYAHEGSELKVDGGDFMCESRRRAGFLMVGDDVLVTITGGLFAHNVAGGRGGAVYCSGIGQSNFTIKGGTFRDNTANEYGGVVSAWGLSTVVEVTGGMFANNSAKFNGGFVYLDGVGSFTCEGASVYDNYAGDQGGGIYAQGTTWISSTCDLIANQALQGSAIHLTSSTSVTLQNLTLSSHLTVGGGMLYMTESSVVANGVSFISGVVLQEDSLSRAIQSDGNSAFTATGCVFDGWLSDTAIYHRSSDADSLSLDGCDFRTSSTTMAVFSLNSDAKIRNAVVGDYTFANTGRLNNSLQLVNRATGCSNPNICGPGKCVDSTLGVLCECLDADNCLNDSGELYLVVETPPASETYSPDKVTFELLVSSASNGTTHTIWDLAFEADDLELDVAPSSGILPPGGSITVVVTGTTETQSVSGNLTSVFNLSSVGSASSKSTAGVTLEVDSTFYLCSAFKYAHTLDAEDGDFSCEPCISISGGEGVDCTSPGATLTTLPLRQGYWRSGRESLVVHKCCHLESCVGATDVLNANGYCADGYEGPYCAVCSEGYRRGVSHICHSCDNTKSQRLIWAGVVAFVVVLLLLSTLAVVFLIGGLDAVDMVRKSVRRSISVTNIAARVWPVSQPRAREDNDVGTIVSSSGVTEESRYGTGKRDIGHRSNKPLPASLGPDNTGRNYVRPSSAVVRPGVRFALLDVLARHASDMEMPAGPLARLRTNDESKSKCCGRGANIKTWLSRLPLHKLKILVVVWQILAVFSSITDVEFPHSYTKFLAWVDVVNFDMGRIFSASCVLPSINFYASLLVTTLTPLALVAVLLSTYHMAKRRAGIGSAGIVARRAAWSRHVGAGLLLTYLVFTSASTLVFKTFACDDAAVDGKSFLRADYSISCQSRWHMFFICYAGLMVLVYPIGIPVLYAVILWRKRELLNPRMHTAVMPEPEGTYKTPKTACSVKRAVIVSMFGRGASAAQTNNELSPQEFKEFNERVKARRDHPELAASLFLWKDYGPDLFFYEVIECGRRILLTGVLVFISPSSSIQVAAACMFAFGTLLGFELLRPHLDPADVWLYRLGGVVIFLSYFLALLIDVDAAGEDARSILADILVATNVVMVLVIFVSPWFTLWPRRAAIGG